MTGLDGEQVDWLHQHMQDMIDWDAPVGRSKSLDLHTALVAVLFSLRQNLADDVTGEIFGCDGDTIVRYRDQLEPLIDTLLEHLPEQVYAHAQREAALVDGFVAPIGERDGIDGLYSTKHGVCGQNVQVVAGLAGRLADVGTPCPGCMHDARAYTQSGIAGRWAAHNTPDGPGLAGDKGYQGTGVITPYKKPRGRDLTDVRKSCNRTLNGLRAAVERAIAHLKCWKILKTGFRRSLHEFPAALRTVVKLEMFRIYGIPKEIPK